MRDFGKNLKQIREKVGLTQEQLAEKISATRQAISSWERGRTEPDIAMLTALGEALNVDAEELIFGRKAKQYKRFQKKYLLCVIVSLSVIFVFFLLQVFLSPHVKEQVNTTYEGSREYVLIFRLLIPTVGYFMTGVFAVSLIALFYNVSLHGWWKRISIILGAFAMVPCVLEMIDFLLSLLILDYRALFIRVLYISTMQPIQSLLYVWFPILSGIFLFLGFNKDIKSIPSEN